jgi:hypothetical protein
MTVHPLRHGVIGGSSSRTAVDGARTVRGAGAVVSEQADIELEAAIDPARAQTHIRDLRVRIEVSGRDEATMLSSAGRSRKLLPRQRLERFNNRPPCRDRL